MGLAMKQVKLETNLQCRLVGRFCTHLRFFKRNRFHLHCTQASQQKCRAESLAGDLAIYLRRRLFDAKLIEQPRKLFVTYATAQHLRLYQLLCSVLPNLIRLGTLIWEFVHHPLSVFQLKLPDSTGRSSTEILGRIRPIANGVRYTSSERNFCEDSLLRIHQIDSVGFPLPVLEGAP